MTNEDHFKKNGYVVVKNALSGDIVDLVTQYALFDEIQDFSIHFQRQVDNVHAKYADPLMESLLLKLLPTMEKNTGLKLFPTYSFFRVYRDESELKPHKDREACEISCSVSFKYSYFDEEYSWPLIIDNQKIFLAPGDLVIYRGKEKSHWREKFNGPSDSWHVQAFLHYVDANGPFADEKFDKRYNIGYPTTVSENKKYIIKKS